jgi:flavin-dependent dehydrogenase
MIGLPPSWDVEVMHRYTFLRLKGSKWHTPAKAMVPMSLDLKGTLNWAWLLPAEGQIQLCVVQPLRSIDQYSPRMLMRHWIEVLGAHKILHGTESAANLVDQAISMDLPLGGALAQEGVANRTLLIGPAGGFYTACAEDIYPNCWSAVHATEVAAKAIKERHPQDALQPYRQQWGATLGDYLRGPQQNLRFLLPLVYRNSTMTARLAEAILRGKSVVR